MLNTEFISNVKKLIGTPYSDCDCAAVIRKSLNISFSGTNWLFRSFNNSSKYKYITELHKCGGGVNPPPGSVVFKADENKIPDGYTDKPNAYHCGVVDDAGYVIHSSPKTGVRKDMTSHWTNWDYWGLMKQVEYSDDSNGSGDSSTSDSISDYCESMTDREILAALYRAVVKD